MSAYASRQVGKRGLRKPADDPARSEGHGGGQGLLRFVGSPLIEQDKGIAIPPKGAGGIERDRGLQQTLSRRPIANQRIRHSQRRGRRRVLRRKGHGVSGAVKPDRCDLVIVAKRELGQEKPERRVLLVPRG